MKFSTGSVATGDPIARIGYKNGVVIGLLISATGSALFWPAASAASYPMFLAALFVVGLGFAMLQIAANPYVTILGPEKTASSRLNLARGFNSIGTTIGPLIGGWLIFQYFAKANTHGADSVKIPYLAFCIVFVALAAVFYFIHLPHVGEGRIERGAAGGGGGFEHSCARRKKSGGGPPQSKTQSVCLRLANHAKRRVVRQSSGAFWMATERDSAATRREGLREGRGDKDSAPHAPGRRAVAGKYPEGIASFSPALTDKFGLRWVVNRKLKSTRNGLNQIAAER